MVLALIWARSGSCQQPVDPLANARSLVDAGKLSEAESAVRTYLTAHNSSADAHFLLGYVLFREQKPKESLAEFTSGASIRRPVAREFKIIASDYVILRDYGDADKWFSEAVAADPSDADTWYLLGRTKFNESTFADSISSLERALALRPKYIEAENNVGLAWRELNNIDKAKAAFQAAIDWQSRAPVDAQPFLNLGSLLADQNQFDDAIPYLEKAVILAPNNPSVHEQLGKVYMGLQDLPKAQSQLERAIALAPDTSSLHFKLAQIYRKEGMRDQADREFAICSKLSSTHSSAKTPNPLELNLPAPH
jgi:tetratricopeptide (TPR) repeat protein